MIVIMYQKSFLQEALRMKLIDFALVYIAFFICLITTSSLKNDMLYANTLNNIMYNDCIDEVVVDSLKMSFYMVDEEGLPVIDKQLLIECYKSELSILFSDSNVMKEMYDDSTVLILNEKDGYYVYCNSMWSDKYLYGNEYTHEDKVYEIENTLLSQYGINLLLPSNDGEKFKNTIGEYALLAIYRTKKVTIDSETYGIYTVSGAAILEK